MANPWEKDWGQPPQKQASPWEKEWGASPAQEENSEHLPSSPAFASKMQAGIDRMGAAPKQDAPVMAYNENSIGEASPEIEIKPLQRGQLSGILMNAAKSKEITQHNAIRQGDWPELRRRIWERVQKSGETDPEKVKEIEADEARRQGKFYGGGREEGVFANIGRSATNTLGLGLPRLMEAATASDIPTAQAHEFLKAADAGRDKKNPIASGVGTGLGIFGQAAALPVGGVTTAGRIGYSALTGGALGATEGAIESRGDVGTTAKHGLLGLLGGGAGGLAGEGLTKGIGAFKKTAEDRAAEMLNAAVRKDGVTAENIASKYDNLGEGAVLGDILGARGDSLIRGANTASPDARQTFASFYDERKQGRPMRLIDALQSAGSSDAKLTSEGIKRRLEETAKPDISAAYESLRNAGLEMSESQLAPFLKNENIAKAFGSAKKQIANEDASNAARKSLQEAGEGQIAGRIAEGKAGDSVFYGNKELPVRYDIVERGDLITSHNSVGQKNANYLHDLQPRDRGDKLSTLQIDDMASNFTPKRFGKSTDANAGAPIVGLDNMVESGNGRTLALGKAYESGKGEQYKSWLKNEGHNIEGFKEPVLIARNMGNLSPEQRIAFAQGLGGESGAKMSASEYAKKDAGRVSDELISLFSGQGKKIDPATAREFFKSASPNELSSLIKDGNLTQAGESRIRAAVLQKAYGDDGLVKRVFEQSDPVATTLGEAFTGASGSFAKMKSAVQRGEIDAAHDITPDLLNIMDRVVAAKKNNRPYGEYINQADLERPFANPSVVDMIFKEGGVLRGKNEITDNINRYARAAETNKSDGFFGAVKPQEMLKDILSKPNRNLAPEEAVAARSLAPALAAPEVNQVARESLLDTLNRKVGFRELDMTKRELDSLANMAKRSGDENAARLYGNDASLIRELTDSQLAAYPQAREKAQELFKRKEAVDLGEELAGRFSREGLEKLKGVKPEYGQQVRDSYISSTVEKIMGKGNTIGSANALDTLGAKSTLQAILGAGEKGVSKQVNAERVFNDKASLLGGSKTAEKLIDNQLVKDGVIASGASGAASMAGQDYSTSGILGLMAAAARRGKGYVDNKRMQAIAPLLAEALMQKAMPARARTAWERAKSRELTPRETLLRALMGSQAALQFDN